MTSVFERREALLEVPDEQRLREEEAEECDVKYYVQTLLRVWVGVLTLAMRQASLVQNFAVWF